MTFKKIVEEMTKREATKWVEKLMDKNGIEYIFTDAKRIDIQKDLSYFTFMVDVEIVRNTFNTTVRVGGTVSDEDGILTSAIWKGDRVIWVSTETARQVLGIESFAI